MPKILSILDGDLLDSKEQYIAHQCNCITKYAQGLALSLFNKFPYANVYKKRNKISTNDSDPLFFSDNIDTPGSINVCGNGKEERFVINMFAQHAPGQPSSLNNVLDGPKARESYFSECLKKIAKLNPTSIAFPYKIGCGLAGGQWKNYFFMLSEFQQTLPNTSVVIYKKL